MTITYLPASMPDVDLLLSQVLPDVGTSWVWEPELDHAREQVVVTATQEFGGEWWVQSEASDGRRYWNYLARWVEATVRIRE